MTRLKQVEQRIFDLVDELIDNELLTEEDGSLHVDTLSSNGVAYVLQELQYARYERDILLNREKNKLKEVEK